MHTQIEGSLSFFGAQCGGKKRYGVVTFLSRTLQYRFDNVPFTSSGGADLAQERTAPEENH